MLWFFLWFVLSAILLGATFWSAKTLYDQKKAWQAFAKKYDLVYEKGKLMQSPTINGFIDNFRISFFAAERQAPDVRQRRVLSALEVTFPKGLVDGVAAGTAEMVPYMTSLKSLRPFVPESDKWNKEFKLFIRHQEAVEAWLTEERLDHIQAILGTKNADVLFLFDNEEAVIRAETRDPLTNPATMERVVQRLIKHSKALLA